MKRLLLVLMAVARAALAQSVPPNIVMIISDDHAWTDYGFMGHPHIKTPNLDKLAAQSLTFRRGYVTSSLCCPSLASLLTGMYPHQHRITSNDPPLSKDGVPGQPRKNDPQFAAGREKMNRFMDAAPGLPRLLKERGYVSLQTGKWWQGNFRRGGFTEGMTDGDPAKGGRHGDGGLEIGRKTMQPIYDFTAGAKKDGKPFFIWYAPMMPHEPHNPPERLLAKYRDKAASPHIARYWAMVEWFDETCGQLLDHLDKEGLAENTIVVFLADNGWIQNPAEERFAPRSKQSQYDGGLRTPIMVRWPAKVKARESSALASSIDIAPTLLRAAGGEPPKEMSGLNLLDDAAMAGRNSIFGECFTHNAVDLDVPAKSLRWRWCIQKDLKLVLPGPNEPDAPVELYDLSMDPQEQRNLATERAEEVLRLRQVIDGWWKGEP
jgi:uncharacterized sulfatase